MESTKEKTFSTFGLAAGYISSLQTAKAGVYTVRVIHGKEVETRNLHSLYKALRLFRDETSVRVVLDLSDSNVEIVETSEFKECKVLGGCVLPKRLKEICAFAFSSCSNMEFLSIPSSVKKIGPYAFSGCKSLKKVKIPKKVKILHSGVFSGCENLEEVKIEKGPVYIAGSTFSGCGFENIEIPEGLESIGAKSFGSCKKLKTVKLSSSVGSVAQDAFENCTFLENIEFEEASKWCKSNSKGKTIEELTLSRIGKGEKVSIKDFLGYSWTKVDWTPSDIDED